MQIPIRSMTMIFFFAIHLLAFPHGVLGMKITAVDLGGIGAPMAVDSGVALMSQPMSLMQVSSDIPETTIEAATSEDQKTSMLVIYSCSMGALIITIAVIYWSRGPLVWMRLIAYLLSLSTITLTVKGIYVNNNFPYPKFISGTHFLTGGLLCTGIMFYRQKYMDRPIPVPSMRQFVQMILPVTFTFATAIAAGNMALVYSSAGFVEMIASTGPVCVVFISIALGIKFHREMFLPVLIVTIGMVLCIRGEVKFSLTGTLFAAYAAFSSSLKSALQHKILGHPREGETTLDPIELLAWMSPCSVLLMLIWSLTTEGTEPWVAIATGDDRVGLIASILRACLNACILNVSNLFVIKDLGAVGAVLLANLKCILVMLGSVVCFNDVITSMQVLGLALELIGVYFYNKVDKQVKDKAAQEEGRRSSKDIESRRSSKDIESAPLLKKH